MTQSRSDQPWTLQLSMHECMRVMTNSAHEIVCDQSDKFPTAILFECVTGPFPHPPFTPIQVHRLKVVWAGRSRRLTVGTATSTILANICCTTRGHSEWVLIPTQPCCGRKHSFLLVSADKQGQALLLVTCRQPASWKHQECCRLRGPPIVPRPIMAVHKRVTASIGTKLPSLVQLDGFGV